MLYLYSEKKITEVHICEGTEYTCKLAVYMSISISNILFRMNFSPHCYL